MDPITAYIAMGSNLGNRGANLSSALAKLSDTPDVRIMTVATPIENPAVGGPTDSPPFLNTVAEVQTTLAPHALLHRLLDIEQQLGRVRREKWGPRLIDLDLILYGDLVVDTPDLKIPHPLMHERRFVLEPLAQIAPDALHPTLHLTIRDLLNALPR